MWLLFALATGLTVAPFATHWRHSASTNVRPRRANIASRVHPPPCAHMSGRAHVRFIAGKMEENPVLFMEDMALTLLVDAIRALSAFVGARPQDLALVPNATTGVNAVVRSFPLKQGDVVLSFVRAPPPLAYAHVPSAWHTDNVTRASCGCACCGCASCGCVCVCACVCRVGFGRA